MKAHSGTGYKLRPMARALTLTAFALLITMSFVPQSFAAAKAPDIDPSRYRDGNMVYPPGKKPSEADIKRKKEEAAEAKKSKAITIQPKPPGTGRGSGSE
jgi:hypothetical protein